jgi:hypothetical protein
MSVKCGRCSQYHENAADVRKCFNGENVASEAPQRKASECLSPKQVNMVVILMRKLGLVWNSPTPIEQLAKWAEGRTLIDQLKAAEEDQAHGKPWSVPEGTQVSARKPSETGERSVSPRKPFPDVPAGHYAVPSLTGNNDLDFFRVDRPTEGAWKGRTFVKRVIGGKPDSPVLGRTAREALETIMKAGVEEAGFRYGQELGRCRRCNRHLTDELSRQLSIGPDCRSQAA